MLSQISNPALVALALLHKGRLTPLVQRKIIMKKKIYGDIEMWTYTPKKKSTKLQILTVVVFIIVAIALASYTDNISYQILGY